MVLPIARENLDVWFTVGVLGLWGYFAVIQRPEWIGEWPRTFYLIPIWLAYASFEAVRVGMDLRFIGGYLLFLAPALIYDYYCKDRKALMFLSLVGILGYVAGAVMSIRILWINPLAARLVSTNLTILTEYWRLGHSGVGDFRFTYGVALLLPLLVAIAAGSGRSRRLRVLSLACVCLFAYFLYLATFAMSIYMMIAGSLVAVFLHIKRLPQKFIASLLALVVSILFLIFGADLMMFVAGNVRSDVLSMKARALASVLPGGPAGASIASDRSSLYRISINTFLENPIAGTGAYHAEKGFDIGLEHGIAGHSEIFDTLARYGLVGAGIFFSIMFPLAFRAASEWRGAAYGKSASFMGLMFLLMCFANPVSGQTEIGVTVFLLWPALPKAFAARGPAFLSARTCMAVSGASMRRLAQTQFQAPSPDCGKPSELNFLIR